MRATDLQPGQAYVVERGQPPKGRAVFAGMREGSSRAALMRFPDRTDQIPADQLEVVQTAQIKACWNDPAQINLRTRRADTDTKASHARAVLAVLGLDVAYPGRQRHISRGPAAVTVGPIMTRWAVTIELDEFVAKVAPELLFAIAERKVDGKRP